MKKLAILISLLIACTNLFSQDIIELKSGNKIEAKLLEITENTIRYKKYDNLEGPTYSTSLSEISSITYENGTKDIFGSITSTESDINITKTENIISNDINALSREMQRNRKLERDKMENKATIIRTCGVIFGLLPIIGTGIACGVTGQWWILPIGLVPGAVVLTTCVIISENMYATVQNSTLEEFHTLNFNINKNTTISTCYFASKQQLIPQKALGLGITVNF